MRRRGKDGDKENPEPIDEKVELQQISESNPILVLLRRFDRSSASMAGGNSEYQLQHHWQMGQRPGEGCNFSGSISLYLWVMMERLSVYKARVGPFTDGKETENEHSSWIIPDMLTRG